MLTKQELRRFAKEKRTILNMNLISQEILQIFFKSNFFLNSYNIAIYYPYQNELDLSGKKAEFAFGDEKIAYLKKQITLLEEQQRIHDQHSSDLAIQQNELKY